MNTTHQDTMQTLEQAHTHDAHYYGDRPNWLIAYTQHRDSDTLTRANWADFLEALGGESDTVAIERSGHWAVGWVEYLVIDPTDSAKITLATELHTRLEDYPVLDEMTLSNLEWSEYQEAWSDYGASDFTRQLTRTFKLSDTTANFLDNVSPDALREWFESLIPSGEYYIPDGSSVSVNLRSAIAYCQRAHVAQFIREQRAQ